MSSEDYDESWDWALTNFDPEKVAKIRVYKKLSKLLDDPKKMAQVLKLLREVK